MAWQKQIQLVSMRMQLDPWPHAVGVVSGIAVRAAVYFSDVA